MDVETLANPILGWAIGWLSFTFLAVVVVAVDYTIASAVAPNLFHYTETAANAWIVTALIMVAQAVLVACSTPWSERINNFSVIAELSGMVALVVLLLIVGVIGRDLSLHNLFSKGAIPSHGYWSFGSGWHVGPWILGTLLGAFTIVGFESAANLAEETRSPQRVIPRAMWQAVLASGVLGFLFLVAVTLSAKNPVKLAASSAPIADIIKSVLGSFVGDPVSHPRRDLDLRLRAGHPHHRRAPDLGDVARSALPGLAAVGADLATDRHPPQRDVLLSDRRRAHPRGLRPAHRCPVQAVLAAATLLPAILYLATVTLFAVRRRRLPASHGFDLKRWQIPWSCSRSSGSSSRCRSSATARSRTPGSTSG